MLVPYNINTLIGFSEMADTTADEILSASMEEALCLLVLATANAAAKAIDGAEAIDPVFIKKLLKLLFEILELYDTIYFEQDDRHILENDGLFEYLIASQKGLEVCGPYDDKAVRSVYHRLVNGEWIYKAWGESIPDDPIKVRLESFWEVVMNHFGSKRVMFHTPDNGLLWKITIYDDDDNWEGTYILGSFGAENFCFHTCDKF